MNDKNLSDEEQGSHPPIVNPYREELSRSMVNRGSGRPYHPEAEGLTGDVLDKILMARFTEGVDKGRVEAFEECKPKIAAAFDQGALAGQQDGFNHARSVFRRQVGVQISATLRALEEISKKTGSKPLEDLADEAHRGLQGAMELV